MKNGRKIWKRLFVNISLIFIMFVVCIYLASSTLFVKYFTYQQQQQMKACAQQIANMDLSDREAAAQILRSAERENNIAVTIYKSGTPVYSTISAAAGSMRPDIDGFDMIINRPDASKEEIKSRPDGPDGRISEISTAGGNILVYSYTPKDNPLSVEVIMEQSLIENSAEIASRFSLLIATACLIIALVWSILFARRFTRPIEQMNKRALQMAQLDFSEKVAVEGDDEIARLGHSLNVLSETLDGALAELSERNRSLQDEIDAERRLEGMRKGFIAGVSHELKTPITIIQGYAEGLNDSMAEDEATRQKYCGVILDESRRMNELVMGLLELSKLESGLKLNNEEFDLASSLINLADCNSRQMSDKRITLHLRFPERIAVTGDRLMTEQVVQNYLSNAISHTPEGGTIYLYTEPYLDGGLRVCVYNAGEQIPQEDMEKLWQSFWRADKAHSRQEGRFGLGLSVVKAIMSAANLDYGVFNAEGGVTFWAQVNNDLPPA